MLLKRFSLIEEKPDLIGITSGMTYWYPGVFKLIEITKKFFQGIPIILGGIYATLCYDHAKKHSGADIVFKSGIELDAAKLISELTQFPNPQSALICYHILPSTLVGEETESGSFPEER